MHHHTWPRLVFKMISLVSWLPASLQLDLRVAFWEVALVRVMMLGLLLVGESASLGGFYTF